MRVAGTVAPQVAFARLGWKVRASTTTLPTRPRTDWEKWLRTIPYQAPPSQDQKTVRIGFIGAGAINFGKPGRVWNHASRLDKFPDVEVTAIVNPNTDLAKERLAEYQAGPNASKWQGCKIFPSYQSMLRHEEAKPDAVFVGIPPEYHGSVHDKDARLELDLAEAGVHMFLEKPLSVKPACEVQQLSDKLHHLQRQKGLIVAVGYMLRYSPAIEAAKKMLQQNRTPIALVAGRYASTYNHTLKRSWWDTTSSGGPIIEQATHLVDAMRYLGGEIQKDSVLAMAIGPDYPLKQMPAAPHAETTVPFEHRANRVTSALWHFESGAIGSLNHSCILHESQYFATLEIVADGLHILIHDPYSNPQVLVRHALSDSYEQVPLELSKDMYTHELETFVHAVRTGDTSDLRVPYQDCALTYQATKWITDASNKNRASGSWQ